MVVVAFHRFSFLQLGSEMIPNIFHHHSTLVSIGTYVHILLLLHEHRTQLISPTSSDFIIFYIYVRFPGDVLMPYHRAFPHYPTPHYLVACRLFNFLSYSNQDCSTPPRSSGIIFYIYYPSTDLVLFRCHC